MRSEDKKSVQAVGPGPRIFVLMGRSAMLPTCRTEGSSLKTE